MIASRLLLPSATKLRRLCFYRRLSVHRGGCLPQCMLGYHTLGSRHHPLGADTPWGGDTTLPPEQTPPLPTEIRPLLRTVCILLECILVYSFNEIPNPHSSVQKAKSIHDTNIEQKLKCGLSGFGKIYLNGFWQ